MITFENPLGAGAARICRTATAAQILCVAMLVTATTGTAHAQIDLPPGLEASIVLDGGDLDDVSGLTVGPEGQLYVSDIGLSSEYDAQILEVDPETGSTSVLVDGFPPISWPGRLIVGDGRDPVGTDLVVADWNADVGPCCDGRVYRIDRATGTATELAQGNPEYPTSGDPFGLALGPGGDFGVDLYVMDLMGYSENPPVLYTIDASGSASTFLTAPSQWTNHSLPSDVAFAPDAFGSHLYVADRAITHPPYFLPSPPTVWRVTASGGLSAFKQGDPLIHPVALAFGTGGPFGTDLFVLDYEADDLSRIGPGRIFRVAPDGSMVSFATNIPDVTHVSDMVFSPDGSRLYVSGKQTIWRIAASTATVAIDIKPGSCPNPLNVRSCGVIPIALAGDAEFDVLEVDASSLRLEGLTPLRTRVDDVATPFDGEPCDCHAATSDGIPDLSLKFETQEIVAAMGQVQDREERPLTLTGTLLDGTPFEGSDCVRILAGGGGPPPAPLVGENPGALGLSLTWEPSDSPYFLTYVVYRGTTPDFVPLASQDFYAAITDPSFLDTEVSPGETWFYRVGVFDEPVIIETPEGTTTVEVFSGYSKVSGSQIQTGAPTVGGLPAMVTLQRPLPNPVSRTAQIVYTLPSRMTVRLSVYNVSGRLVDRLVDRVESPGEHFVHWDAGRLPSGSYFFRLEAGSEVRTGRATLVR